MILLYFLTLLISIIKSRSICFMFFYVFYNDDHVICHLRQFSFFFSDLQTFYFFTCLFMLSSTMLKPVLRIKILALFLMQRKSSYCCIIKFDGSFSFIFISFVEMSSTWYLIHPFKVYNSMVLSICTEICIYHHNQFQNIFISVKRKNYTKIQDGNKPNSEIH